MWARHVEVMIALWLALSPFIFHYQKGMTPFWVNDFVCAFLIILFSLLSYFPILKRMHLLNLLMGLWLIVLSFLQPQPLPPHFFPAYFQNYIILGILYLMLSLIPCHCTLPPEKWQKFYAAKRTFS